MHEDYIFLFSYAEFDGVFTYSWVCSRTSNSGRSSWGKRKLWLLLIRSALTRSDQLSQISFSPDHTHKKFMSENHYFHRISTSSDTCTLNLECFEGKNSLINFLDTIHTEIFFFFIVFFFFFSIDLFILPRRCSVTYTVIRFGLLHSIVEKLLLSPTVVSPCKVPTFLFVKLVSPFRNPINQHFWWGLLFAWSAPGGVPWLHGCSRNVRNITKSEEVGHGWT